MKQETGRNVFVCVPREPGNSLCDVVQVDAGRLLRLLDVARQAEGLQVGGELTLTARCVGVGPRVAAAEREGFLLSGMPQLVPAEVSSADGWSAFVDCSKPDVFLVGADVDHANRVLLHRRNLEAALDQQLTAQTKKIYESRIVVTVLSEDGPVGDQSLGDIAYEIMDGGWLGQHEVVSAWRLSEQEAATRLVDLGSDASFFGVGEDEADDPLDASSQDVLFFKKVYSPGVTGVVMMTPDDVEEGLEQWILQEDGPSYSFMHAITGTSGESPCYTSVRPGGWQRVVSSEEVAAYCYLFGVSSQVQPERPRGG